MTVPKFIAVPLRAARWGAAFVGVAAAALGLALATPLQTPVPLASIQEGARAVDTSGAPALSYFTARDGTQLAYRLYGPTGAGNGETLVVIHGSAGHSMTMNATSKAFAAAGYRVFAVDMRGHGASGARGDVSYDGQSEDDFADFLDAVDVRAGAILLGHSMGGGFALRVAQGPLGDRFKRVVLSAPFLGVHAPSTRPSEDGARWASVDTPRIVALSILKRLGWTCCDSLPVIAYGLPPEARRFATTQYSFRLLSSFGVRDMRYRDLSDVKAPLEIVAGARDELMDSARYKDIAATNPKARARVVADVDHMGMARAPHALAALIAAAAGEP